jgi:glycosyltransferase involved in cell wall biosynthesis
MVGDAYEGYEYLYTAVADKIIKAGVANMVTNLGYRTDTAQIIKGLDLLVLPSIKFDSFPLVVLEAMAAEKPVIATNLGGAVEQVQHGVTGYLVPTDNAAQVANYLKQLIDNPVLLSEMGLNAKKRLSENFLLSNFEQNLVTLVASMQ